MPCICLLTCEDRNPSKVCQFILHRPQFTEAKCVLWGLIAPQENNASSVIDIMHVAQHAEHGGNADTTGNHNDLTVWRKIKMAETAKRSLEINLVPRLDAIYLLGPVTTAADGARHTVGP